MHDWNILALDIVHHNLSYLRIQPSVPQEKQVASLKRGLHGSGEHNDNGGRRVGDDGKSFPHHEGGRQHERKVEDLCGELPRLHACDAKHGCGFGRVCVWTYTVIDRREREKGPADGRCVCV
jgi:hypothetical protein